MIFFSIEELYCSYFLKLMYGYHHCELPTSVYIVFTPNRNVHSYCTTNRDVPHKLNYDGGFQYKTCLYAPKLWVGVTNDITKILYVRLIIKNVKSMGI